MEVEINGTSGQSTVNYTDDKGETKSASERLKLPPDMANGLIPIILKNIQSGTPRLQVSMVAATPKPRLVKLIISPRGEESFSIAGSRKTATDYGVKVELGGIAGVIAPIIGKQPPDTHVWILGGEAPAFLRMEGPLYVGGPVWRIELASPTWPDSENARNGEE